MKIQLFHYLSVAGQQALVLDPETAALPFDFEPVMPGIELSIASDEELAMISGSDPTKVWNALLHSGCYVLPEDKVNPAVARGVGQYQRTMDAQRRH
jgi:hypothetical protein